MYKVLIVDDEILARAGIKALIDWEKYGFSVIGEASNGQIAFEKIKEMKPDIVITDIKMPVMNGIDLIRATKKISQEISFIVLSAYNDFEYVKEAMKEGAKDYILKIQMEPEDLIRILQNVASDMESEKKNKKDIEKLFDRGMIAVEEKSFRDIIFGKIRTEEEMKEALSYFTNFKADCHFTCMVVHTQSKGIYDNKIDKGVYDIVTFIIDVIKESVIHLDGSIIHHVNNYDFVLLLNVEEEGYGFEISQISQNIQNSLKKYLNLKSWIGISLLHSAPESIKKAYEEAFAASRRCVQFLGKSYIYYHELLNEDNSSQLTEDKNYMDELIKLEDALYKGSVKEINAVFKDIKEKVVASSTITKREIEKLYFNLSFIINSSQYKLNISDGHNPAINTINDIDDFIDMTRELQQVVVNKIKGIDQKQQAILDAKKFIQYNYKNPISLTDVADFVGLSPTYFSELFKKEEDINFIDYLIEFRIKKAKHLLRYTDYKIYEVAREVGYENIYYFSRIFKRQTGLSPKQYRQNKSKKAEEKAKIEDGKI